MHTIWRDAEDPVEYHGPPLRFENIGKLGLFGNLIQTLAPLILVVVSLLLVVMSYYAAPSSLIIRDSPILHQPKYFIAVIHDWNESAFRDGARRDSYSHAASSLLFSNFPMVFSQTVFPTGLSAFMRGYVTRERYLDITVSLKHNVTYPSVEFFQISLFIPITMQFPNLGRQVSHALLRYEAALNGSLSSSKLVGRLDIEQKRVFKRREPYGKHSLESFLEENFQINGTHGYTAEDLAKSFENEPFRLRILPTYESITPYRSTVAQDEFSFHIQLRIPDIFAEMKAPFWNMFKVTYVQLFYWFWLVYIIWTAFISTGFRYGVIPSAVRRPLKSVKIHSD
jgi:hypothetical protein